MPLHGQRELENQKLLIDESSLSLGQTFCIGGEMDLAQCLPKRPKALRRKIRFWKNLVEQIDENIKRAANHVPQVPLLQSFCERIDREHLPGRDFFVRINPLHARMGHFPPPAAESGLARDEHILPARKLLAHERLVEPQRPQVELILPDQHAQQRAADPRASHIHLLDHAAHAQQLVLLKVGDRPHVGQVLIIARKEEQHVASGLQPQPLEQFPSRRPDSFEIRHWRRQHLGRRLNGPACGGLLLCATHAVILANRRAHNMLSIERWCIDFVRRLVSILLLLLAGVSSVAAEEPRAEVAAPTSGRLLVYVGTYTHGKGPAESKGIYRGQLDLATGKVTIDGVTPTVEPSFLAIDSSRQFLYAVNEVEKLDGVNAGGVSAFAIDAKSGELKFLNRRSSEGTDPCHLAVDNDRKFVLVANYGNGNLAVLQIEPDGSIGKPRQVISRSIASRGGDRFDPQRQEGPHAALCRSRFGESLCARSRFGIGFTVRREI